MIKLHKLEDLVDVEFILTDDDMHLRKLSVFYPFGSLVEGIEEELQTLLADPTTAQDYYISRLEKHLSVLYERLYNYYKPNDLVPLYIALGNARDKLYSMIKNKYLQNWNSLTKSLFADYNPIQNYDMTEHKEEDNDKSVNTDMKTETSETQKYAGFNSGATLPVASESEGESTTTGLKANNKQIDDNEYTLTRSGNIGVTTSQQMIESEIALRRKTLLDIIYNDIDKILFLNYYG